MHRFLLAGLFLAVSGLALGQSIPADAVSQPPPDSDVGLIMQMARLAAPDHNITDPAKQLMSLLENIQKLPSVLEQLEKKYPASGYLSDAYSLVLNAMVTARQYDPNSFTNEQIGTVCQKLAAAAKKEEHKAQAQFVLLQLQGLDLIKSSTGKAESAPATQPSSMPASAGSAPASSAASVPAASFPASAAASAPCSSPAGQLDGPFAQLARRFIQFAQEHSGTSYAGQAMMQAAGLYFEAGADDQAIATLERLARDFPKDPSSATALLVLAKLYDQQGESDLAMQAKRTLVERFPDSSLAQKFKAEVARETVRGKSFEFNFKSVTGAALASKDLSGKPTLAYFFAAITPRSFTDSVVANLRELQELADAHGYNLIAIGAEPDFATKAAGDIVAHSQIKTPVFLDPEGTLATSLGISALPAVVVVDEDLKVQDVLMASDIVAKTKSYVTAPASQAASAPTTQPASSPCSQPSSAPTSKPAVQP